LIVALLVTLIVVLILHPTFRLCCGLLRSTATRRECAVCCRGCAHMECKGRMHWRPP
jgi:hypothetical protein